ncbi:MAG: HD domain-containing protein [Lachnospiraceae bacterium]|nr:HD domain-containing protein [Lachnospiraceae bacterium]
MRRFSLKNEKHRRFFYAFLISFGGVLVNLILGYFMTFFDIPLYLDTIGSMIVAAMGGFLPGVLVGFVTNLLKLTYDPTAMYYGVLNVLIAFFTAFFARRGWFKKAWGVIGMIFIFTFIGGGIGSLIPWFMDGLSFDSESLAGVLYGTGFFNAVWAHIVSSLVTDLPDKALSVLVAFTVLRAIPQKYHRLARYEDHPQSDVSAREEEEPDYRAKGRKTNRIMSLKTKILLVMSFSLATVAIVSIVIGMVVYRKTMIREHTRIAQGTADTVARILNADMIDSYLVMGSETGSYAVEKKMLEDILYGSTDITYLYVYKIMEDGCHVVFDISTEDTEAEELGTVIPFDEGFKDDLPDLLAGRPIDPVITNDKYGYLLTAYSPVYNSAGRCVCYVGADVDMGILAQMQRSYLVEMISVFLGFFILVCVFVVWLSETQLIIPVNSISRYINGLAGTEDIQDIIDENIRNFRKLDIRTGDEVEKLYDSIGRMMVNQSEQLRSIRRLSDSTAKMQDGLIITMADMVENRDSDTGAHIQKTAAYVKIIVEGLKKKGYYAEKITPKFMSDVVRSAPLHDVGKINIPDWVLNKPGKLSDEEYEIMKTHTTAGKDILDKAIKTVKGGNYLKEARNMAAYHHERWDGRGYPEGLHGEVIPLSARIMAVADVFDALTSPRVYKPAFSLEEALRLINEGRGTQFDPKCVEALMDSLPEVQVILRKYSKSV